MSSCPTRIGIAISIAAAAGALLLWPPVASAAQMRPPVVPDDPVQVLADAVLIESSCGQINVDYGKLFAYAERHGIDPVDVMPFGGRRSAFDAATRRRTRDAQGDALCGTLAAEVAATIPGVFTAR